IYQENIATVCYRIADQRIPFASYRHMHFWHPVTDAFIGED
ncbi:NAD kinase, partial [Enterococcus faecalis]